MRGALRRTVLGLAAWAAAAAVLCPALLSPSGAAHAPAASLLRFAVTGPRTVVAALDEMSDLRPGDPVFAEGARPKRSPEEVAGAVTRTVIRSTVLVLLTHAAFALFEF